MTINRKEYRYRLDEGYVTLSQLVEASPEKRDEYARQNSEIYSAIRFIDEGYRGRDLFQMVYYGELQQYL